MRYVRTFRETDGVKIRRARVACLDGFGDVGAVRRRTGGVWISCEANLVVYDDVDSASSRIL